MKAEIIHEGLLWYHKSLIFQLLRAFFLAHINPFFNQRGQAEVSVEQQIFEILETVLKHQAMPPQDITSDKPLYDDGLGLDSLCVAELSALLEKQFKSDPYTQGILPQTVADLVAFYGDAG